MCWKVNMKSRPCTESRGSQTITWWKVIRPIPRSGPMLLTRMHWCKPYFQFLLFLQWACMRLYFCFCHECVWDFCLHEYMNAWMYETIFHLFIYERKYDCMDKSIRFPLSSFFIFQTFQFVCLFWYQHSESNALFAIIEFIWYWILSWKVRDITKTWSSC